MEIVLVTIAISCVAFVVGFAVSWWIEEAPRRDSAHRNKQQRRARQGTWKVR